jgi:hypothetical protein
MVLTNFVCDELLCLLTGLKTANNLYLLSRESQQSQFKYIISQNTLLINEPLCDLDL